MLTMNLTRILLMMMLSLEYNGLCHKESGGVYDESDEINGYEHYRNYIIIEAEKTNDREMILILNKLKDLQIEEFGDIIFLDDDVTTKHPTRFLVNSDHIEETEDFLRENDVKYQVIDNNVGEVFDLWEWNMNLNQKALHHDSFRTLGIHRPLNYYLTYDQMVEYLKDITDRHEIAELWNIGKSHEERDMFVVKINHGKKTLPAVWIDAGIDPRKWMAQAVALYFLFQVLEGENTDDIILRDNFRWYIAPNINPDGYVHTLEKDRFFRKTRSSYPEALHPAHANQTCYGVDLKRNWDSPLFNHGKLYPCSPLYAGPHPFSEVESQHVKDVILQLKKDIHLFLSLQSHGQGILAPGMLRGFQENEHLKLQSKLAEDAVLAMKSQEFKREYTFGKALETKHPITGWNIDWAYHNKKIDGLTRGIKHDPSEDKPGIKMAFAIDLPPTSMNDYNYIHISDPPTHIYVTGSEFTAGVTAMCRHLVNGTSSHDEL